LYAWNQGELDKGFSRPMKMMHQITIVELPKPMILLRVSSVWSLEVAIFQTSKKDDDLL
jgi:hypothetical protein